MANLTTWWKKRLRLFADQVDAPTSSEVTASSARLSWAAEPGAVLYGLERSTAAEPAWVSVYTTPSGMSYLDPGLAEGTQYLYRLAVTNAAGLVVYSPATLVTTTNEAVTLDPPPTGPDIADETATNLGVSMPAVSGATRYILQRIKASVAPPPPPPPPEGLEFTSAVPPDTYISNALTGHSRTFSWSGPADYTYWTRLNNQPWVNEGSAKSKTQVVGGIGPSFPADSYDNIADASYQTFQVISRSPQGVYSAPIVQEWRASIYNPARLGMSGTFKTLFVRTEWTGGTLNHGTDTADRAKIVTALTPFVTYSRGAVSAPYDMTAVLTIPAPSTTTLTAENYTEILNKIVNDAYNAAVAAGWTSTYGQVLVATPPLSGFAGAAFNTQTPMKAWVGNGLDPNFPDEHQMMTHETGHNLGFGHDGQYTDKPFTTASYTDDTEAEGWFEYGDESSVMSDDRAGSGHPSALQLGQKTPWIARPKNVTVNGTYTISSIETDNPANPHTLLVNVSNAATPKRRVYWVSVRQATGIGAYMSGSTFITNNGDFTAGVMIHASGNGTFGASGALSLGSGKNLPLPVGSTFTDPDGTLTIKLLSKTASTATIQVGGLPAAPSA